MDAGSDLLARIPHRRPWSLVDRVVEVGTAVVRAEKLVTDGDPLVDGALPELLVVEAMAQAAACLNAAGDAAARHASHEGYLVAATGFTFDGRPRAGDRLRLTLERTASLGALHRFRGEASVDDRVVARGELTFAVGGAG